MAHRTEAVVSVVTASMASAVAEFVAAVGASVVIEVVLAVVPRVGDAAAGVILRAVDARPLARRHVAVGAGPVFHALDVRLVAFEAGRFARGQRAGALTLLDATLLRGLALIDGGGGVPLATVVLRQDGQGQGSGEGEGEQATGFHLAIS